MMEDNLGDIATKVRSIREIMDIPMRKLERNCKKKEARNDRNINKYILRSHIHNYPSESMRRPQTA